MKRLALHILVLLGVSVGAAHGADFWKEKKFTDWTPKEVQKMLSDSPWARPVEIRLEAGRTGGAGGGRGRRGGGAGIPSAASGERGMGGEDFGDRGGRGGMEMEATPTATIYLRWHSALPIKQAVQRLRFGNEVANSPEAAKILGRQETAYIVGVAGLPPGMVRGKPEELKGKALLKVKKKPPIETLDIKVDRDRRAVNLYLFFPRERDGAPAITLEDQEVEFVLKAGPLDIRRKFKLRDMVFDGKLEI